MTEQTYFDDLKKYYYNKLCTATSITKFEEKIYQRKYNFKFLEQFKQSKKEKRDKKPK